MSFKWDFVLWLGLLLIPLGGLAYLWFVRRRASSARAFTSAAMAPNVVMSPARWRAHVPLLLYVLATIALLLALARPVASQEVPREQATVMLVMDSSRSMINTDVKPSRLDAAQAAAAELLDQLPEQFRVGVVGFDTFARVLNRPTIDRVALRRALASMRTRRGTAIGSGVMRGLEVLGRQARVDRRPPAVLLLLSDGNNTTGISPEVAAQRARRAGIPVFAIGLGKTTAVVGAARPANFESLSRIARVTGGRFFSAPTSERLRSVYRDLASRVSYEIERREVSSLFVGAALVLLLSGGMLSSLWFHRFP